MNFILGLTYLTLFRLTSSSSSSWGGAYEINDPGCSQCEDPHPLTGSCSCPAGYLTPSFRVINDCAGPGVLHGGNIISCIQNTVLSDGDFGGMYQVDDNVPGSMGCRSVNIYTGACSCPNGAQAISTRTLADVTGGIIGSNIIFCYFPGNGVVSFGGVFQQTDTSTCQVGNPYTGRCSCPNIAGIQPQAIRVLTDGPIGSWINICSPTAPPVELCSGIQVDPTGRADATVAFQQCIDSTPVGGNLPIPPGAYSIGDQLVISKSISLTTKGVTTSDKPCLQSSISCAILRANYNLVKPFGILLLPPGVNSVSFDHIVLDGNRGARQGNAAYQACAGGNNSPGFNAYTQGCDGCSLTNSASINAVCGTGWAWSGTNSQIINNLFANNGDHFTTNLWSDGLTLLGGDNAIVTGNTFQDNSDVNFIMGSGINTKAYSNSVLMTPNGYAFAGIMMDNFNGGTSGNYSGLLLQANLVNCSNRCHYGIEVGPRAWYQPPNNIYGGTVFQNTISGAAFLINVDGGGTPTEPVSLYQNVFGDFTPNVQFLCGKTYPGTYLNISPDSYVNRNGETSPKATTDAWYNCP